MSTIRDGRRPVGKLASDITPVKVKWIDPGRLPIGHLVVLDGDPGLGKTTVAMDYAARLTRGDVMPSGVKGHLYGKPAGVVVISCEDDQASTLVPKLLALGADLERIQFVDATVDEDGEESSIDFLDVSALEHAIRAVKAKLVIWDPFMAYMPDGRNAHRDQDVRKSLAPLVKLAHRLGITILVIRHLNKMGGDTKVQVSALYRGGGSIGVGGAARSVLLIARDTEDEAGERRCLVRVKGNLWPESLPGLLFRLVGGEGEPAIVEWGEETHQKADELIRPLRLDEEPEKLREAALWLRDALENGERPAREVVEEAKKDGHAPRTIRRAFKKVCNSRKGREGSHAGFIWSLKPQAEVKVAKEPKIATQKSCQDDVPPSHRCYFELVG